ncbi:MAG: AarF/UbiB family protein [Propionibacteriales bacterium]|nr:AarF/UbiB family protein [Propionibacteriales bacterium]
MDAVVWVVAALINAGLLGLLSRRLLGTPVGWPRTFLISLVVSSVAGPVVAAAWRALGVAELRTMPAGGYVPAPVLIMSGVTILIVAWIVVLQVIVMVILEAFAPTGSLPGPIQLLRSMPARRVRAKRYLAIIGILAKHGLAGYLRPRARTESPARVARALREAMTDAGVTFVKLGQMLATRPDVVPSAFVAEFSSLHSAVPAEPWDMIRPVVERELGRGVDEVFTDVDPTPLAAASVAQIHAATLLDGTAVVIKVQRPRARAQAAADLDILDQLARRIERATGWGRALGVVALRDGFAASLQEELDYRIELANMQAVAAASEAVRVPTPYPELSSERLMVMERLQGRALSQAGDHLADLPAERRAEMGRDLFTAVMRQVMVSGVFHADLHPGNIFVLDTEQLALLDLGSVGRLDRAARTALGMLMMATDRGDAIAATDALLELLDPPTDLDDRSLERQVGHLLLRYGGGIGRSGAGEMFGDLVRLVVQHRFAIPPAVAAAFRALGALEGSLHLLTSDIDLVATAREQGRQLISAQLEPAALRSELEAQLAGWLPTLQRLPRRVNQLSEQLEDGRLTVAVSLFGRPAERAFITSVAHQLVLTALSAALAICGVLFVVAPGGPMLLTPLSLHQVLGAPLLLFAFTLGARVLVLVFREPTAPVPLTPGRR